MITNLSQQQWDQKAIDLGGSILQSWAWGELQAALGYKVYRFSSDSYLNMVVELPLPFGKKYLYSARGPLGDLTAALTDLNNLSADRAVVFARLEPMHEMNLPKAAKDTQPTHNWLLDIDRPEETILSAMKSKHRYNLNLAAKKGVTVRRGTKEDILPLWQLFLETASRNKFRLHSQNYYWQLFEHLHPGNMEILLAEYQGKVLAGMVLTIFGGTATYMHGGSASVMKEAMAPYLLHWEAIKLSRSLGCRFYDFGGVAPENEPQHSWVGITRFKKGFGGFELRTPGAYDLIFSPVWYNVYTNARKFQKFLKR